MIAGQSRSGRSNSLRVLAGGIARLCSPEDVHLYGIDAGNNALLPLMALPHVGAVVTRTQTDRMYRLVAFLQKELADRQQSLAEQGYADIGEQRAGAAPEERLPYLVVLLDRWEGFVQAFESVDGGVLLERITALLQEGAGVGIRMVMTARPQRARRPDQHPDRGPDRAVDERPGRLRQHRHPDPRGARLDAAGPVLPRRRAPARGAVGPARRQRRRHRPGARAPGPRSRGERAVRRPPALAPTAARRRPAGRDHGQGGSRPRAGQRQPRLRPGRCGRGQPGAPGLRSRDRRQRVHDHRPAPVREEHRPAVHALPRASYAGDGDRAAPLAAARRHPATASRCSPARSRSSRSPSTSTRPAATR